MRKICFETYNGRLITKKETKHKKKKLKTFQPNIYIDKL